MWRSLFHSRRGDDGASIRLPPTWKPLEYELKIWPHVLAESDWTFEGSVKIRVECLKWSRVVTLHARDLTIEEDEACQN